MMLASSSMKATAFTSLLWAFAITSTDCTQMEVSPQVQPKIIT